MKTLGRLYRLAGSPEVAISSGLVATLCFIVGSAAMQLAPGAYRDIPGEDVTFVWRHWSPVHSWLVAATGALGLFFAATFVCTVEALRTRLRTRPRALAVWATPLMHLGFLVGLIGHLLSAVGGVRPETVMLVEGSPVEARGLGLKLLEAKVVNGPTGEPRHVEAAVEVTDKRPAGGPTEVRGLGFNHPIVLDRGRDLVLLMKTMPVGGEEGRFEIGGATRTLRPGETWKTPGNATIRLVAVYGPPRFRTEVAKLEVGIGDGAPTPRIVGVGQPVSAGGETIRFLGATVKTGLIALVDRNAGAPILLAGMILFTAGLAFFLPGRLRRG